MMFWQTTGGILKSVNKLAKRLEEHHARAFKAGTDLQAQAIRLEDKAAVAFDDAMHAQRAADKLRNLVA